jgi:hypothetical protein
VHNVGCFSTHQDNQLRDRRSAHHVGNRPPTRR